MTFNEYQALAKSTAVYSVPGVGIYSAMGLAGESGEAVDKIKKLHRDHGGVVTPAIAAGVALELGDALWYISDLAGQFGYTLQQIAELNIEKLESRRERNVIHGSGDNR